MNNYKSSKEVIMTDFRLNEKHIKLLRHAYVRWEDIETGAPAIDGKRPYGNSDVAADVIELLFGDVPEDTREALYDYAMQLHKETETALQIVLTTGEFKPGKYTRRDRYNFRSWELVK